MQGEENVSWIGGGRSKIHQINATILTKEESQQQKENMSLSFSSVSSRRCVRGDGANEKLGVLQTFEGRDRARFYFSFLSQPEKS